MSASNSLFDQTPLDSPTQPEESTTMHSVRITDNLWLSSSDSVGTNGQAPSMSQIRSWIKDLRGEFEYVLINAPPIGLFGDAALLGQTADGVVLVLEANSTRRLAALKAKQVLDAAKVRLLGIVLNNRTFPIPEKVYRWL